MVTGIVIGTAALGLIVSLFGDRYECSPEEVQAACEELSNISNNTIQAISEEIGKNVTIVNNVAYGYVDISNMNAYAPAVQDSITNLIGVLDKQAQMIEDYNNGSLVEKMIGTGTMAILNLTEGVAKFGEDIVDAGANIIAGVGSVCGFDMEAVELWAAKDHVGEAFDNAFENGALNWVEKYSIYSHESTAAELFKGIGTAIPYIALAAIPGANLVVEASVAGAAGFGRGSTNYQQQHLVYDANGEASFDETYSTGSMMWEGAKQGAIDAATVVVMDKGIKAIGKGISKLKAGKALAESADDVGKAVINGADDVGKAVVENADDVGKAVINKVDDVGKAVVENTDDVGKAVINKVDDVGKAVVENTDDVGKAVINKVDDVGKAVVENADDVGKAVVENADDIGENAFSRYAKEMSEGKKLKYENFLNDGNKATKAVAENADDLGRAAVNSADDAGRAVIKGAEDAGQTVLRETDDLADGLNKLKEANAKAAELKKLSQEGKIPESEWRAARDEARNLAKNYHPDANVGRFTPTENVGKTVINGADDAGRAVIKGADDVGKTANNIVENTAKTVPTEAAEQTAKVTQSGSKWHSPLEATTPRAKITKAYDTAVENMKNAASDVKSKIKGAFDGMKPSGSTAATGPRIGDNSIPARVTQAYDNAVEGIKNVGAKAGTAAKKVATDTAKFVTENPKATIIGGGVLSTEKAIGNIKTSYIPTNYASEEVQELSKIGGGENRIVIDEVDDLMAQTGTDTPTTPEKTKPSQTNTGGTSTGGGTYTAPTTPSSNTSSGTNGTGTSTTPSEKPSDGNTTKPDTNDNNNNNNNVDNNNNADNNNNNNNNKSDDSNKTPDNTTPTTPEPTPTPGDNGSTVISNPPNNNNQGSSGTNHGGTTNNNTGNSSTGNNNWSSNTTTEPGIEENPELEPELPIEDSDLIDEPGEEESVYTIPSNLSGVKQTKKSSSGSSVLPVLGGLGAAAAVGVGAKMYLDNKKNNENGDDDEEYDESDDENFNTSGNDDLLADEWNGEDTEFNYEEPSGDNSVGTDDDDLGEM